MFKFMRYVLLFSCIFSCLFFAACGAAERAPESGQQGQPPQEEAQSGPQGGLEEGQNGVKKMYLTVGDAVLTATLADNDAARALADLLPLTLSLRDYGGFEKVGSIGSNLPREDERITMTAGDLILYQGNQFVLCYGENVWSYTRLGRIEGVTQAQLQEILGTGDITVKLSLTIG